MEGTKEEEEVKYEIVHSCQNNIKITGPFQQILWIVSANTLSETKYPNMFVHINI